MHKKTPCGSAAGRLFVHLVGRNRKKAEKRRLRLGKMTKRLSLMEGQMSGEVGGEGRGMCVMGGQKKRKSDGKAVLYRKNGTIFRSNSLL